MLGIGLSIPQIAASGGSGWLNAPAFADLCAIADFNRWRFALPVVALADIPAATAAELCLKRAATVEEFFAFTCSSTAARTYTDATGTLRGDLAVDQLRRDWINGRLQLALNSPSTNQIRNSTVMGAVAGSPGTVPANWIISATPAGLTRTITTGATDGVQWIELRYSGTAEADSGLRRERPFDYAQRSVRRQRWRPSTGQPYADLPRARRVRQHRRLWRWLVRRRRDQSLSPVEHPPLRTDGARMITQLELRFPDAATALEIARAISGNPDVSELPPDGAIGGVRYDIAVVNGDGRLHAPPPDDETSGEPIHGYHVIGLWRGPPETVPEPLRPFMLEPGTLGVRFG